MNRMLLSGVLHFQAYCTFRRTKNFQVYHRAVQLKNGMMPVYKKPVNQPSQIWQENKDRTIQDGRVEARHDI